MVEKDFIIDNEAGLHARPAATFTKVANSYKSDVYIIKDGKIGNGKSLLSILALGLTEDVNLKFKL